MSGFDADFGLEMRSIVKGGEPVNMDRGSRRGLLEVLEWLPALLRKRAPLLLKRSPLAFLPWDGPVERVDAIGWTKWREFRRLIVWTLPEASAGEFVEAIDKAFPELTQEECTERQWPRRLAPYKDAKGHSDLLVRARWMLDGLAVARGADLSPPPPPLMLRDTDAIPSDAHAWRAGELKAARAAAFANLDALEPGTEVRGLEVILADERGGRILAPAGMRVGLEWLREEVNELEEAGA